MRGGIDCAVIGDSVCLQVEVITLIDVAFGDGRPGNSSEILRLQDSHSAISKRNAENATKEPEGETFNEQLSRNPHLPGAKGRAYCKPLCSRLRPYQD